MWGKEKLFQISWEGERGRTRSMCVLMQRGRQFMWEEEKLFQISWKSKEASLKFVNKDHVLWLNLQSQINSKIHTTVQ